jgi:hypothetical protein
MVWRISASGIDTVQGQQRAMGSKIDMINPEGIEHEPVPPSPDRLSAADRDRFRAEYEAAAARRALLALNAPLWRRALALLPNPKQPLESWIAATKARLRNRL